MIKRIIPLLSVLLLLTIAAPLGAQSPCTVVYGGGVQTDGSPYCMESLSNTSPSPTGMQDQPRSQFPSANSGQVPSQSQTKGGLTVQTSPNVSSQPATGPESAILLGMLPAGALGWYLRKKTA